MFQHSFSGTKEQSFTNDLLKNTIFSKNYTPFMSLNFNFRKPDGMSIGLYHNKTLTLTNSVSTLNEPRIDRNSTNSISFDIEYTRLKQKDLKFFKSNIQIQNAFTFSFDISFEDNYSDYVILTNPNQDIEWINSTFSKSITATPGFTYEFSEWIDCTFYISHNIMETNTTNKKDESSVGFNLLIYFESQSSN